MKVLVTGADGFLGRHLVPELLNKNIEVIALVYGNQNVFKEYQSSVLKIIDVDLTKELPGIPNDIDIMFHLAWIGVSPEYRNDINVQSANIEMSLNCIRMAKQSGIRRVIFPGSTNEYLYYGKAINRDAIPSPSDCYGATKIAVRYMCSAYAKENSIEFIYAIVTGIYASDRRDSNVIFYTIDKLLRDEKPSLTKLEQLWDYVYIDDVINAFIAIATKGREGSVYAVGHGDNWPLARYIKMIHQIINPSIELGIGDIPYKSEKLPCSCIDLSDLRNDTGFVPKVPFEEGILKVIDSVKRG